MSDSGELPDGWQLVPLGQLGKYVNGRAFEPSEWELEGLPIIRIQNLTNPEAPFNYHSKPVEQRYYVHNGDLLISWSATLGSYIWDRGNAILNQHIFRVEVNEQQVDKLYLKYAITAALTELKERTHGSTMRHVTKSEFESFTIPLPSTLAEQRRIVAHIETAFARLTEARRLLESITQETDLLPKTAVEEIFRDGRTQGWPLVFIRDLIVGKPQYGISVKATEESKGIPVIRMGNIHQGQVSFEHLKYVELSPADEAKYLLNEGDILFNRTNSAELVGKSAVYLGKRPAVFASYLIRIVADIQKALPEFIVAYINSPLGREYIQAELVRAIGQVNVNANKLLAMAIPTPSVDIQRRIVTYLDSVQAQVAALRSAQAVAAAELTQLEESILARAFRGEL